MTVCVLLIGNIVNQVVRETNNCATNGWMNPCFRVDAPKCCFTYHISFTSSNMHPYVLFYGWEVTPSYPITLACFSQWYDVKFVDPNYSGVVFRTAEHYMMYRKALLFDPSVADAIIDAKTPGEAKQMGRRVKNFDREIWDKHADDIVERGNCLKFDQHDGLRRHLFDTGDKTMVEASPTDRIWGIGFSTEEAADHEKEWGQNR